MNTLTKVLMTLALIVVGYYLFIGLFYVVAAGVFLMLALSGFSFLQKYWRKFFGGEEPANSSAFFTIDVQHSRPSASTERGHGMNPFSDRHRGAEGVKEPSKIKIIDVN